MKIRIFLVLAVFSLLSLQTAYAGNQPKGHISNIDGKHCTFTQKTKKEKYLHSLEANTGTLLFDDPKCMSADGLANDVNRMMIANFIAKPYAQPDAAFETRAGEFRAGSALQRRGVCIQSSTYAGVGIVAEFQNNDGFITGVKHAMAVQGCSN